MRCRAPCQAGAQCAGERAGDGQELLLLGHWQVAEGLADFGVVRPTPHRPHRRARGTAVADTSKPKGGLPEPVVSPHHGQVQSTYQGAQISPANFKPHADPQVTQTVGMNPDPPAVRQASPDVSQSVPYMGESPTGYNLFTGGIQ